MEAFNLSQQQKVLAVGIIATIVLLVMILLPSQKDSGVELSNVDSPVIGSSDLNNDDLIVDQYYFVEIMGQVKKPGVYEISPDTRVIELISRAGGYTDYVNMLFVHKQLPLARRVIDEEKIYIPSIFESSSVNTSDKTATQSNSIGSKININNASVGQLVELPGVGEITANKIISNRPIADESALLEIDGIGEKLVGQIRDLIEY